MPSQFEDKDTVNLLDYLYVIWKWKNFIIINVLLGIVLIVVITLFMPNWYKSSAVILPPEQQSALSSLPQIARDFLPANLLGRFGVSNLADRYLAVLNSRTMMEELTNTFNLAEVYGVKNQSTEKTIRQLRKNTNFDFQKDGTITIDIFDRDPIRAAEMANYITGKLNELLIILDTQEARNNREFIERRYIQVQDDLRITEELLKEFQQTYGIYALPEQTEVAIKNAAELQSMIFVAEVELNVMRRSLSPENVQLQTKLAELQELRKIFNELKVGHDEWFSDQSTTLFIPFKDIPELGMEYIRRYRDFEIQNKIFQFIIPLYEQAKIEEQKDIPQLLILDKAIPAERKEKPRRSIIVIATFIFLTFFLMFVVFILEFIARRDHNINPLERKLIHGIQSVKNLYRVE
jgi:tyrosine-protein kinase Etk/Wzc